MESDVRLHVRRKIEHPTIGARLVTAGTTVLHIELLSTVIIALAPLVGPYLV